MSSLTDLEESKFSLVVGSVPSLTGIVATEGAKVTSFIEFVEVPLVAAFKTVAANSKIR